MAKRRAEDTLLHDAAPKRCYRSLCSVDMQPGGMAPSGGVSPPSLLALLGNRCRKRPHYFEEPEKQEEESALSLKPTKCDIRKHGADADTDAEDCTYNSFQYWRVPLPELDLSLLEDNNDHTQTKNKSKEKYSSSDTMEA
uniref:Putative WW-binding domain-containing protein n=1 Tax=Labrus bergylta TaxID=56723 RepID=A0A3Q3G8R6_9LABR